ncbi:MAG: acyltransferase family protein [Halioglobus sp.]
MQPKYRADIDGLRAIAVMSVLFFHSGSSIFSGGYVGVDIFFVISGYLITTIIVREIASDSFSISDFYERRFRRILPALTAVVLFSLLAGFFLLTPAYLMELGKSVIATTLFSSNFLFHSDAGYFDRAAEMKPLLHTWSLAVEEQYYIFFPLLLILIAKMDTRHYLRWLLVLGALSFISCVVVTDSNASAAFYLIPSRAWELFLGSVLALNVLARTENRWARESLAVLGLGLIVYSVTCFTDDTVFPGIAAIAPTLGSALIIYAGINGQTSVSRLLSLRPFVFVGLISYSLYLWHWPIIVYTKIYSIAEPEAVTTTVMFIATFLISVLSWRYIETPFRKRSLCGSKRSMLSASAIGSLVLVCGGLVVLLADGFPQRYSQAIPERFSSYDTDWEHWKSCEKKSRKAEQMSDLCPLGAADKTSSFILWGDSHAKALASGLDMKAKEYQVTGAIAAKAGCPPLTGIDRPGQTSCHRFNQSMLALLADAPEIHTVILAARWTLSSKGTRYKNEGGEPVSLVDLQSPDADNLSNVALIEKGLQRTMDELRKMGKEVVLVGSVPDIGHEVPSAYYVAEVSSRNLEHLISPTRKEYLQRTGEVISLLEKLEKTQSVYVVKPGPYLCNTDYCEVKAEGIPLYRDDNHLSTFGSRYIGRAYDEMFTDILLVEK